MKPLRIPSWNVLHGVGTRCGQIPSTTETYDSDKVQLQEFRYGGTRIILINGLDPPGLGAIFTPKTSSARENTLIIASRVAMKAESFPDDSTPAKAIKATLEVSATVNLNLVAVYFPQKKNKYRCLMRCWNCRVAGLRTVLY